MTIKYAGKELTLGGTKYIFPPLTMGHIEMYGPQLRTFESLDIVEAATFSIDLCLASLRRNYPEIKREEVADIVDLSNFKNIVSVVMNVSGMVEEDKEKVSGDTEAGE